MALANVALTDTFDYWRTVTNSLVVALNDNILFFKSANANTVSITLTGGRQANIYMNVITTSSYTDVSSANIASTLAVNTVHGLAYSWVGAANSNTQISVASANAWTNAASLAANSWANMVALSANSWANTVASSVNSNVIISVSSANAWANSVGTGGNNYASILVANNAVGANTWANTKLSNTSGISFAGSLTIPGGLTTPVIYDLNDTTYFVDPASTSNLNTINAATAIKTPILYDLDNANYYVNPAGLTVLNTLKLDTDLWLTSSDSYNRLYFNNLSSTYLVGSSTAHYWIRFGTQDNTTRAIFEGAGNFYATGNITAYWSDERLKKNIVKIDNWREIIKGMNGYRFEWNEIGNTLLDNSEPGVQVGLIAQEVQRVLPQAAAVQMLQYKDKDGDVLTPRDDIDYDPENPYLTVREEKIIPVLVEAIKGLMEEIEELKKRLP